MANSSTVIKKISAFDKLPNDKLNGKEMFIIARDNTNYKVSLLDIYTFVDMYMSQNASSINGYVNDNYVSKDYAATNYVRRAELDKLIADINSTFKAYEQEHELTFVTREWVHDNTVSQEEVDAIDNKINHLESTVYTKDETQALLNDMLGTIDSKMSALKTEIKTELESTISSKIESALEEYDNNVETPIITTGEGDKFLGNDGQYHDITAYKFMYGDIINLDNSMYDESKETLTVYVDLHDLKPKSILMFTLLLQNSNLSDDCLAKSIYLDTEFTSVNKKFTNGREVVNISIEFEVGQFTDISGALSNLVKVKSYCGEELVNDKISIRSTAIDILHDYQVPIKINLTNKLANTAIPSTLTYRVFGI